MSVPRRPSVPASARALDRRAVERALVDSRGSVTKAARALSVPSVDLRRLIWATPSLADAAFEQIERAIDAAQQALRDGLKSGDKAKRLQAATVLLTQSEAGRRRGWGRA